MKIRTYSELQRLHTIEERFEYLRLSGEVGARTFGGERYVNQQFYTSKLWRDARNFVIARDNGCDLGIDGFEVHDKIYVHHMNPMNVDQIQSGDVAILDPEFLISVTHRTHNGIHYGDSSALPRKIVERRPGDTKLW